jgi:hypothetical protein
MPEIAFLKQNTEGAGYPKLPFCPHSEQILAFIQSERIAVDSATSLRSRKNRNESQNECSSQSQSRANFRSGGQTLNTSLQSFPQHKPFDEILLQLRDQLLDNI